MGTDERPPAGALIERLLSRPQGFNLFQAISLLERAVPHAAPLGEGTNRPEAVRLNAVVSLGFQPSDVAGVALGAPTGESFTLRSPVMSLAGAQGPLPMPLTELLLERRAARDHATADFLDIFNHRLLSFFYRGRKKHHLGLNWASPEASSIASSLDSLSALGLGIGARSPNGETSWLRHAGLMGGAPRSLAGLCALLNDRLGVEVKGRSFQGGWQRLEASEQCRLGRSGAARLGRSAVLGRRAWYQSAGIQLEIRGLTLARLRHFLPGAGDHTLTGWLVSRYVQQELRVELVLRPAAAEVRRARLGSQDGLRLGWTSWLATGTTAAPAPTRLQLSSDKHVH